MNTIKKSLLGLSVISTLAISSTTFAAYGLPEQKPVPVVRNWYIGGSVGPSYTPTPDEFISTSLSTEGSIINGGLLNPFVNATGNSLKGIHYNNPGVNAGLHIGYHFGDFRLEGEYLFQQVKFNHRNEFIGEHVNGPLTIFNGVPTTTAFDVVDTFATQNNVNSGMLNAFYDVTGFSSRFAPYVGLGIGVAHFNTSVHVNHVESNERFLGADGLPSTDLVPADFVDNRSLLASATTTFNRFAFQIMAGFNVDVMENLKMGIGYRYFATTTINDNGDRFQNHNFQVSMDYLFA